MKARRDPAPCSQSGSLAGLSISHGALPAAGTYDRLVTCGNRGDWIRTSDLMVPKRVLTPLRHCRKSLETRAFRAL